MIYRPKKHGAAVFSALLMCLLFFLSGCGGKVQWYKPHHFQTDFDRDNLECETIAHELARQATMTGKGEDLATFIGSYNNCLSRRGWSNTPPAVQNSEGQIKSPPDAVLAQGKIHGFGKTVAIPQGFTLLAETSQVAGPIAAQNFQWQGDDSTFIHLIYQKIAAKSFDPIDYVVVEPFFLYERGKDKNKPDLLRWAVFAGEIKKSWVVGLGSYVLTNKDKRIIVVVTRSLPPPEASPPAGMRLSKGQQEAAERFMEEWLGWLTTTFPSQ